MPMNTGISALRRLSGNAENRLVRPRSFDAAFDKIGPLASTAVWGVLRRSALARGHPRAFVGAAPHHVEVSRYGRPREHDRRWPDFRSGAPLCSAPSHRDLDGRGRLDEGRLA